MIVFYLPTLNDGLTLHISRQVRLYLFILFILSQFIYHEHFGFFYLKEFQHKAAKFECFFRCVVNVRYKKYVQVFLNKKTSLPTVHNRILINY